MNRRLILLSALALALAGALVADRLSRAPEAPTTAPMTPPAAPAPQAPAEGALNPVARLDPATLAPLFDRPLFAPTRQAAAPEAETPETETAPAAPPEVAAPLPVLLGTVAQPQPGWAYLSAGAGGETAFVAVGQDFHGWTLREVGSDWARLESAAGPLTLRFPDPMGAAPAEP